LIRVVVANDILLCVKVLIWAINRIGWEQCILNIGWEQLAKLLCIDPSSSLV